jgi:hypothetical protein
MQHVEFLAFDLGTLVAQSVNPKLKRAVVKDTPILQEIV